MAHPLPIVIEEGSPPSSPPPPPSQKGDHGAGSKQTIRKESIVNVEEALKFVANMSASPHVPSMAAALTPSGSAPAPAVPRFSIHSVSSLQLDTPGEPRRPSDIESAELHKEAVDHNAHEIDKMTAELMALAKELDGSAESDHAEVQSQFEKNL